ncbi:MAG: carbonic anhydrase, partial [Myxococcota bacterium]|nr:carbonic anhydrase [Myxococcota bacterium]
SLEDGQSPKTAVIRCADSRVAPELVFDVTLGDLFVCGVAGNIPTEEIMASIEYAVSNLGTELILVMGHASCGAVGAALSHRDEIGSLPGNLPGLLSQILPSVLAVDTDSEEALPAAVKRNAEDAASRITKMSSVVDDAVAEGRVGIVSGVYDLSSGRFALNGAS